MCAALPLPCCGLRATALCCVQIKVEGEASKLNNLRAKHQGAGHPLDDASVAISEAVTALEAAESSCVVCALLTLPAAANSHTYDACARSGAKLWSATLRLGLRCSMSLKRR